MELVANGTRSSQTEIPKRNSPIFFANGKRPLASLFAPLMFAGHHNQSTLLTTVKSRFCEPPREMKIGSKNRRVREIGGKITVFD